MQEAFLAIYVLNYIIYTTLSRLPEDCCSKPAALIIVSASELFKKWCNGVKMVVRVPIRIQNVWKTMVWYQREYALNKKKSVLSPHCRKSQFWGLYKNVLVKVQMYSNRSRANIWIYFKHAVPGFFSERLYPYWALKHRNNSVRGSLLGY